LGKVFSDRNKVIALFYSPFWNFICSSVFIFAFLVGFFFFLVGCPLRKTVEMLLARLFGLDGFLDFSILFCLQLGNDAFIGLSQS